MNIWNQLKHFDISENWGNYKKINGALLLILDKITEEIKNYSWHKYKKITPCIVHCAYKTKGHSPNSQHYLGNAVDFSFKNFSAAESYKLIIKILKELQVDNSIGLGVYPDWQNQGFHLDIRGYKARWAKINGTYCIIDKGIERLKK